MMKCDEQGVPRLVQKIEYVSYGMWVDVWFFNGGFQRFAVDGLAQQVGLLQQELTPEQYMDAETSINRIAPYYWQEWFPNEPKGELYE